MINTTQKMIDEEFTTAHMDMLHQIIRIINKCMHVHTYSNSSHRSHYEMTSFDHLKYSQPGIRNTHPLPKICCKIVYATVVVNKSLH